MTNQEAIEWVNERMCFGRYTLTEHNPLVIDDCFKAGEMAIEALEQEPCEDAVSRKELLEHFDELVYSWENRHLAEAL